MDEFNRYLEEYANQVLEDLKAEGVGINWRVEHVECKFTSEGGSAPIICTVIYATETGQRMPPVIFDHQNGDGSTEGIRRANVAEIKSRLRTLHKRIDDGDIQ
jgi:hypothetical protein